MSGTVKEAGFKFTLWSGRVTTSVCYFDLTQENIQRNIVIPDDPSTPQNESATFTTASGKERSRGIEYDLFWQIRPDLDVQLVGTNFDGKVIADIQAPERVGRPLNSASENAYSLFATYRLKTATWHGLSIGGGVNYASEQTRNGGTARFFQNDDATTYVNGFARYTRKFGAKEATFAINVSNLLDDSYIDSGFHNPGRSIKGTVSLRF